MLKRHRGVSIEVYSVIWTNPFDHLSSYANREGINVVSTRSTGFRTNKRYAIVLEFLGDLCLKVGFCLSVIPFSSEMMRWYKQVSGERQSDTSTAFKLLG